VYNDLPKPSNITLQASAPIVNIMEPIYAAGIITSFATFNEKKLEDWD